MAFDAREATVESVQDAIRSSAVSCRDIIEAFLARIEEHNPHINAIISLNPNALEDADELDRRLRDGEVPNLLFGVPILLKDNFDAVGLPTTAGSLALQDSWPSQDAPVVAALRKAGTIILGKTNLHEFALEGLSVSSLGGQTINPYDSTRTPGGSSGGSGAAVAASFAVMATGTDTMNSLRNPASANSLYSFRPTRGLISTEGVVPVSSTQDAVGMIGRSLLDIRTALNVMAKRDPNSYDSVDVDYAIGLKDPNPKPLRSYRIGILHSFIDQISSPETDPVNEAMQKVQDLLHSEHATIIDIHDNETFNAPKILATTDVQVYEIRDQMNEYLSSPHLEGNHPGTFAEIFDNPSNTNININTNPKFLIIPSQYSFIHTALTTPAPSLSPDYHTRLNAINSLTHTLHNLFKTHTLSCLIYPQQRTLPVPLSSPSQTSRNGILAAVTGSPAICMPIGFSQPSPTAPIGVPIGMEILGLPGSESELFEIAGAIDRLLRARRPVVGKLAEMSVRVRYVDVPVIRPGGLASVDVKAYPPGWLGG